MKGTRMMLEDVFCISAKPSTFVFLIEKFLHSKGENVLTKIKCLILVIQIAIFLETARKQISYTL